MMKKMTYEEVLKDIYYNVSNPASYSSAKKLYDAAKSQIPNLTINQVNDWLSGENTYTLHKQARRRFVREKVLVTAPYEQFQADLVDMQAFSKFNNGFKYILTIIDCFSRYAFAIPVKNKSASEIKNALEKVFTDHKPFKLQTDRGKEFLNTPVQSYLKSNGIHYFSTYNSTIKCSIVERFNRTLKSKMFKYFSAKGTRKWIDILNQLVDSYNKSYHRTIKTFPSNVNEDNKNDIFQNIYGVGSEREYLLSKKSKPKLNVGDKVRRKYELTPMDKGYYPNWTDVVYTVTNSMKGKNKPLYAVKVFDGNRLKQRFYPEELQKIKDKVYRIEKIVKRQTRNGRKGFIVKWLNYSDAFNSWIPEEELIHL